MFLLVCAILAAVSDVVQIFLVYFFPLLGCYSWGLAVGSCMGEKGSLRYLTVVGVYLTETRDLGT